MGRRLSVLTATVFLVLLVFTGTALAVVPMDATNWEVDETAFIEGASKPTVCYDEEDGIYHLWYLKSDKKLYYQTSNDLDTWTNHGECTGYNSNDYADNAFIIKTDKDSQFYLWCTDKDGTEIVRLSSANGINWENEVVVLEKGEGDGAWDGDKIDHPMVIKDGEEYKMYYQGRNADKEYCIGLATADSLTDEFSRHGDNPVLSSSESAWDSYRVFQPWVVRVNDGDYYMFYAGNTEGQGGPAAIGVIRSEDGQSWTNADEPIITREADASTSDPVAHPAVAHLNGTWHLWFLKSENNTDKIYHATAISSIGKTVVTFTVKGEVPGDPMYPDIIAISVPDKLEFGDIETNSTESKDLTIENIGNVDVGVTCAVLDATGGTITVTDPTENIAVGETGTAEVTVTVGSTVGDGSATITVTATATE